MNLLCDPDLSNYLLDKCLIVAKDFAKAQIEAGCDYIGIGDAICSQIDAETYIAYVKDRHKELVAYIHSLGSKVKLHICGNIEHILPSISELNLDIIDIDWQVNVLKARDILGENIVLKGNINPVFIQEASVQQLEDFTTELLANTRNQRFILSGGCEIGVNTPLANLMKLSEISKRTGSNKKAIQIKTG